MDSPKLAHSLAPRFGGHTYVRAYQSMDGVAELTVMAVRGDRVVLRALVRSRPES